VEINEAEVPVKILKYGLAPDPAAPAAIAAAPGRR